MVASTEKNKELTSTQEGMIAGLVLLFFGLLYWYLNPWDADTPSPLLTEQESTTGFIQRNSLASNPSTTTSTTASTPTTTTETPLPQTTTPAATPIKAALTAATAQPATPSPTVAPIATTPPAATTLTTTPPATATATAIADPTTSQPLPPPGPVAEAEPLPVAAATPNKLELASGSPEAELQSYLSSNTLETPVTLDGIAFEPQTSQLTQASEANVLLLAALLAQYPQANILITSYTDETRPNSENSAELSLMRANAVGVELVKAGIERRRITIMGMGKPTSPDPTSAISKKSQRIEVSVIQ
ncbi:OmpA family protein [Thiothrix eikelboomii]|uniref:OmpA family protein n=1 Tax=Thiothrix eikelboomii TaxID=92487 RepID=UPI003BB1FA8F